MRIRVYHAPGAKAHAVDVDELLRFLYETVFDNDIGHLGRLGEMKQINGDEFVIR